MLYEVITMGLKASRLAPYKNLIADSASAAEGRRTLHDLWAIHVDVPLIAERRPSIFLLPSDSARMGYRVGEEACFR